MYEKIVLISLSAGNLGALLLVLNSVLFSKLSNTALFEFFKGGHPGGIIAALSIVAGIIGLLLFLIYLFKKNKTKWILITDIILIITFIALLLITSSLY